MPPLGEPAVRIMQACALCMRSLPLDEENFIYCPRCKRFVCARCKRACACGVVRCYLCLEEIHGSTRGESCEACAPALGGKA